MRANILLKKLPFRVMYAILRLRTFAPQNKLCMKKIVTKNELYSIYEVDSEYLHQVVEFVVKMNYCHHESEEGTMDWIDYKIKELSLEELSFSGKSMLFTVENNDNKIIGSIRVMKWNEIDELPMQKLFNINPLDYIKGNKDSTYWHVGRFAVDSNADSIFLFKQLMMYAIYFIYHEADGYMLAECDSKLLRITRVLGINAIKLGAGVRYLGSDTIPVYADKKGLSVFYRKYSYLHDTETDECLSLKAE
jgi:hypothetical protein